MQHCEQCWTYNIPDDQTVCPICGAEDMGDDSNPRFDPEVWAGGDGLDYETRYED
jgi:hypothetical protein